MTSTIFSFLAAASAAFANLFYRKNSQESENNSNTNGYLIFFYLTAFLLSFVFYPTIFFEDLNYFILGIGICVGVLNIAMMIFTSRALKKGPAGLTFAFQNTSAVFPGMILFLLFGTEYGFSCSYLQVIGILLVVFGLFLGAKNEAGDRSANLLKWLKYAFACLVVQVLALTLIQARYVIFDSTPIEASTSFSLASRDDVCFMIGQFGVALLIQTVYFFSQKSSFPKKSALFGSLGGVANFISTTLLLLATKWALPYEKALLFPCFAVGTIVICNIWANRLYGEKFNVASNATCASGILIGLIP